MRKEFIKTVSDILDYDSNTVLLLGDIGIYGFRDQFKKHPNRVFNYGIAEQSMIGVAAGLSLNGLIPIVHTITPFLVERAYEQLKIDFGYNHIGGNFISVGGSYDYAALGATHQCPADINLLMNIPNMQIVVAGHHKEFTTLFRDTYNNTSPTYFRLTEHPNRDDYDVIFGEALKIKSGKDATIVVVGNMLDRVLDATKHLDVTILYYTTLHPFDYKSIYRNCNKKMIIVEEYYSGGLLYKVMSCCAFPAEYECIGVGCEFNKNYGTYEEHNEQEGLTVEYMRERIKYFIKE